jgi:metal-responsive CopG/Arc/MetJ family transcriptional regulator
MKTAISIPDDLYAEAECLARRLNRSRSRLYADAVREYLARHDPDAVTEALNRVCDLMDPGIDPAVEAAGTQLLERVEW